MPNWCLNVLEVYAPTPKLGQTVLERVATKDQVFSLETFYPLPRKWLDTLEGLDWRVAHWGTKWDVNNPLRVVYPHMKTPIHMVYEFETAWTPPKPGIIKLSSLFPKVQFELRFDEPSNDFSGMITCLKGEIIEEETGPSHANDDFFNATEEKVKEDIADEIPYKEWY